MRLRDNLGMKWDESQHEIEGDSLYQDITIFQGVAECVDLEKRKNHYRDILLVFIKPLSLDLCYFRSILMFYIEE